MDGLNVKFSGRILESAFYTDKFGSYIPRQDQLRSEDVAKRIDRQLRAKTGLWKRMTDMYFKTDIEFTDNPEGNSPVLGAGYKLFGPRPTDGLKFRGRLDNLKSSDPGLQKKMKKRAEKIKQDTLDLLILHKSLKPDETDYKNYLIWQVEGDQVLTGGGFDNNAVGEVHKSALNFVIKAQNPIDYEDSELSRMVVEESIKLRDYLVSQGMVLGSLKPDGASTVRFEQDKDGMMGFPVFGPANAELTHDIATRLLIATGVDVRSHIGTEVIDINSREVYTYRNIDAIAYILDNSVFGTQDLYSIVTLLARIQKHGYILKDDNYTLQSLEAKPGKTRSVYPNAAIEGMIEAMIASPFLKALQESKVDIMPSLHDKQTRVDMITEMLKRFIMDDYDMLAADSSQYDATVDGSIFATVLYYAIRPFYNSNYHEWFDRAIYLLTFKYLVMDENLTSLWPELKNEAMQVSNYAKVYRPFEIYGFTNGLISGAKFTHVGGSFYGQVVIHRCIPLLIGYEPRFAPQAGDDTLMAYPLSLFRETAEETYAPIEEAAAKFGLEINKSKQIWHSVLDEVAKIFLQEVYHLKTETFGVGSIFRPRAAAFTTERNKGLSIAEQMIAEISRANGGYDNPFNIEVLTDWLEKEQFLGVLFKEHGVNAFSIITDSIGLDMNALSEKIDVGSFSFGISREQLESRNLPILTAFESASLKAEVNVSLPEALKTLQIEEREELSSYNPDIEVIDDVFDD